MARIPLRRRLRVRIHLGPWMLVENIRNASLMKLLTHLHLKVIRVLAWLHCLYHFAIGLHHGEEVALSHSSIFLKFTAAGAVLHAVCTEVVLTGEAYVKSRWTTGSVVKALLVLELLLLAIPTEEALLQVCELDRLSTPETANNALPHWVLAHELPVMVNVLLLSVILIYQILEEHLLFAPHHIAGEAVPLPIEGEVSGEEFEERGVLPELKAGVLADPEQSAVGADLFIPVLVELEEDLDSRVYLS